MSNCNSCPSKNSCKSQATCNIKNNPNNNIKKIIAVMSGKGGLCKSTVTALIAKKLNKMGYKVGKSYCNRGKEYSLTGNFKKAKDDYTRSIEHGYDSSCLYRHYGNTNTNTYDRRICKYRG